MREFKGKMALLALVAVAAATALVTWGITPWLGNVLNRPISTASLGDVAALVVLHAWLSQKE